MRPRHYTRSFPGILAAVALVVSFASPSLGAESATVIPAPKMDLPATTGTQTAVIAGGCFWGVQGVFQHTAGVLNAVSGYAGGDKSTAMYEIVGTGTTGHAESVEIKYDPRKISYGKILQIFFSVAHDPTQLNRQGPDVGDQYRSEVFTLDDAQVASAKKAIEVAEKRLGKKVVTKVEPLGPFWKAEEYHQQYDEKSGTHSCPIGKLSPKGA